MAGPSLVVTVAANIAALQQDMAKAAASIGTLTDATKATTASTSYLTTGIGALAGAFTLAKVAGFAGDLINAAGHLQDLAERTDIGVEALQRFKIIAEQSGSSIDAVSTAVFQMGKRLAGGGDSVVEGVKALGLNFQTIRTMRPEDAFQAIGTALAGLPDPMQRSKVGADLFGRSVDELIPVMKHLSDETRGYLPLSAAQIKAVDWLGDAYVAFKANLVPVTVAMIDNTFQLSKAIPFWQALFGSFGDLPTVVGPAKVATLALGMSFEEASKMAKLLDIEVKASIETNKDLQRETIALEKSVREYYNWVGERAIEHEQTIQTALAKEAAAYRAFMNEMGVLRMEEDGRAMAAAEAKALALAGEGQALMEAADAEHAARVAAAGLNTEVAKTPDIARQAGAQVRDLATILNTAAGVIVGSAQAMSGAIAQASRDGDRMLTDAYTKAGFIPSSTFLSGAPRTAGQSPFQNQVTRRGGGGPVSAGSPYLVGERGPELFVPGRSGSIVPNGDSAGGGSSVTNIYITQPLGTPSAIAAAVDAALIQRQREIGTRF